MATAAAASVRPAQAGCGLPLGRRSPKGRERWYLLHVPAGRERSISSELLKLVPRDVLADAFVPRRERWIKRAGVWLTEVSPMYPSYVVAVSGDAVGLDSALRKLTVSASLVGERGSSWAPLADDAVRWLTAVMDGQHVIRTSTGVIENGVLRITSGPLMGQEASIVKIDRHRRICRVRISDVDGGFTEVAPLEIPFKS